MGFVVKKSASYTWPVEISIPSDGGTYEKQTFDAEFKRLGQTRITEIMRQAVDSELSDVDVATEVLVGWKGILDDDRNEIPFSISQRDELFEIPTFTTTLTRAWMQSIAGAPRKN